MIKKIKVKIARHPYHIYVGRDALSCLPGAIRFNKCGSEAVVITSPRIRALHGKRIKRELKKVCNSILTLTVPDSEKSKNAKLALALIEKITKFDRRKKVFLVAFGGGVIGDLAGFIAAIYKRGIPYIQIPTTLLAQVDSSIGGKTAVDTTFGKNLVGAFYQPRLTVSDLSLLKTLAKEQMLEGLSEGVKYAIIKDPRLFAYLEKNYSKILKKDCVALTHLIYRCASIKAEVVSKDEFDKKGVRIILNFGHTIGHAVEAASNFRITHGDAVSIGMVCACQLSNKLGLLNHSVTNRITTLIKKIGLAASIRNRPSLLRGIKLNSILKAMAYDKKFSSQTNRFVLVERIGKTKIVENIPQDLIRSVIREQVL